MNARSVLTAAALVVVTAAVTTKVVSQDAKHDAPPMSPEEMEMMQKWMAYAMPGPEHAILAKKAGTWDHHVKWWMDPNGEPAESRGSSEHKMIMGGRYLVDRNTGDTPFGPFEGMGCTGYDNLKKKYVTTWIDNMGTGIMFSEGTYDPETETLTFTGESPDIMNGGFKTVRTVERWTGEDTWVMEMYEVNPDGTEFMAMQVTCTRRK